jgi:hypothetical protein
MGRERFGVAVYIHSVTTEYEGSMIEEWRDVVGAAGLYEVSNLGRVRKDGGRVMATQRVSKDDAHRRARLTIADKRVKRLVHVLVLEAFVGPRPLGMESCHDDDDPENNALSNLRWDTSLGNKQDAQRNGRTARGERIAQSTLTEAQVRKIKSAAGKSERELAREFGVTRGAIQGVKRGTTWAWLEV